MFTKITWPRPLRLALALLSSLALGAASVASADVITWDLNPQSLEAPAGTSSFTYMDSGYSITANGYTAGGPNVPLDLYFKNQGFDETGLGVAGTVDNELDGPNQQFIQLDLTSILAQGFTNGQLKIGSVQSSSNDQFRFYGSNTAGALGTQLGGTFDSSADLLFQNIASFGDYNYVSVTAFSGDVLPVAFQAASPIPEASTFAWALGLAAVFPVAARWRRKASESR